MEFNPTEHLFGQKEPPEIVSKVKKDPVERKEIAPDIFLEKELDMRLEGGENPRYLFKLVSRSLRVITFEVDFTGSSNVEYYQDSAEPICDQLKFSRTVEPQQPL